MNCTVHIISVQDKGTRRCNGVLNVHPGMQMLMNWETANVKKMDKCHAEYWDNTMDKGNAEYWDT